MDLFRQPLHPNDASPHAVLVVDDDPLCREVLACLIESLGHRVLAAGSGAEALSLAAQAAVSRVLLDAQMPDMDGAALLQRLRATPAGRDLPVCVMSATLPPRGAEAFAAAGVAQYLLKPIEVDALRRMLGGGAVPPCARPAPDDASPAPLDEAVWSRLASSMGSAAALQELVQAFVADAAVAIPRLRSTPSCDVPALAHRLKGGGAMLGAVRMVRCCAALEDASLDRATARAWTTELERAFDAARAALEERVNETRAAAQGAV